MFAVRTWIELFSITSILSMIVFSVSAILLN